MILEGKIIGNRYEIIEKIGNGGMATVYKAKCHVLNRYVAIKVLRDEFTTDEEFIKRFNTEAQSAASLTHPNIVSIYDVGNEGNLYYIVMELIQGKTLKQIIEEDGALPWKWSVNIAIQISSALEVAHKNKIVHRDIKPHNIIITEDGIAKVTDFGIAKAVSNSTITAFGTTIGSVHYFSPEHARGGFTDAKSDLYSLGVVMYEMLTGRVPFDADTPVSIALKHMQEKPIEPIKLNPAIPFAVNQIILKAMQKESNLRYQSATEMLRDLSMALKNPDGNFVMNRENLEFGQTQRIPTINSEVLRSKEELLNNKQQKEGFFAEHPKSKIVMIILGLIIVCALCFLVPYFIISSSSPKNIDVPSVTGMRQSEAESLLKEKKINTEITEEYNSNVEAGKVISQDPPAGYKVLEKTGKVKLVISKGSELTTVPKVAGDTYEDAENKIKTAKLEVEKIEETSQKIQEGIVIRQEPAENTSLNAGDTVKLYVSKGTGIKQIAVPSVIGKSEEDAKTELTKEGFEVTIVNEEDRSKKSGEVLKQSLDVGKTVDEGTKIIITVNKIAEKKRASIFVNVKSLTGGYTEPKKPEKNNNKKEENKVDGQNSTEVENKVEETQEPEIQKTVKLKVTVDGETIYNSDVDKNTTNLNVGEAVGTGTVTIKLFIDDVKSSEKDLDLSTNSSYTFD